MTIVHQRITSHHRNVAKKAIEIAIEYERLTGRKLGITGEVGEIFACDRLKLFLLNDQIAPGIDAKDEKGNTYQIKSKRVIGNEGTLGSFSSHKYDYAVMVLLDREYKIIEIRVAPFSKIDPIVQRRTRRNPTVQQFRAVSDMVKMSKLG